MNILFLIMGCILVFILLNNKLENFEDTSFSLQDSSLQSLQSLQDSNYNKFKLNLQLNDDHYLDFLERLNNSYQTKIKSNVNDKSPFKVTCDDNKNKNITIASLTEAFDKEPDTNKATQDTIKQLISKDPTIYNSQIDSDVCIHKADLLCQHTNPGNYINTTTKHFPSRHLGPYKNTELSKITDLNCWNKMYSCCIKKI